MLAKLLTPSYKANGRRTLTDEEQLKLSQVVERTQLALDKLLTVNDDEQARAKLKQSVVAIKSLIDETPSSVDDELIHSIASLFTGNVFTFVEDYSSMNRSVERMAWNQTWANSERRTHSSSYKPVSYIQLSGQPEAYRGNPIRVSGSVRGAEIIDLPEEHLLGFESYKVLWVKPEDSKRNPFCIYAKELPAGFPDIEERFEKLNESVTIEGVFFKIRSYTATNNQIESCPLIIADRISWTKQAIVAQQPKWTPPGWMLVLFLIGMPIVATLMAWAVYRTTQSPVYRKDVVAADKLGESFKDLANDSGIQSDKEKLRQLSRTNDSDEPS